MFGRLGPRDRASLRQTFPYLLIVVLIVRLGGATGAYADDLNSLPKVAKVDRQPLVAQARRVVEALDLLGSPLEPATKSKLDKAFVDPDAARSIAMIQDILDPLCLVDVEINPESRVKARRGPARAVLMRNGRRVFLVKVRNDGGVTARLKASSPNADPVYRRSSGSPEPALIVKPEDAVDRWLDLAMFDDRPLNPTLSGLELEYRIIELSSRDQGRREAKIRFDVGQGTQDLGFRGDVDILFQCEPAVEVALEILDDDGKPTTASLVVRDPRGRVYPSPSRRLAPDFFFHPQVYRASGETLALPPGRFEIEFTRGPEYLIQKRTIEVPDKPTHHETFRLKRWIHLTKLGWYSGDHHVHAAGCAHYENPTRGVGPEDMMRHILGEDLDVGCVLSWGPCWYAQKAFFDGKVHKLSTPDYLMRYDVEVSGFPSSHAGHLCLLRLTEDDYPGTTRIEEWPSWDLPVLKWGKSQGGVVGFSHSGWGLQTKSEELPNYEIPPFDGIGANEYIVDVTRDAVDFISTVDTPAPWELNIWYHTLNCGYRTRISGETDFPCIYGERVGLGRVYVKLGEGKLDYDRWVAGLKAGRSYVGDGKSHLIDFKADDRELGVGDSELKIDKPGLVHVTAKAAARLDAVPTAEDEAIRRRPLHDKPYWDIERARIGATRKVPVELIVDGYPAAKTEIEADGSIQQISFNVQIDRSSWIALRIYPSSHTNPIFVIVGDKPIRASKKSAEWCLKSVDRCWEKKAPAIRDSEKQAAKAEFDFARSAYQKILAESSVD